MDDLGEKLSGILNDPASMEQVRRLAENLLGNNEERHPSPLADSLGELPQDTETVANIMRIIGKMKNADSDPRTRLLTALRPHLSEERQKKVDSAVKILRLLDLLPELKESGLLNLF